MRTNLNTKYYRTFTSILCLICAAIALPVSAKICPGGTCDVPSATDCSTYQEIVITSSVSGNTTPHNGVVLVNWQVSNCASESGTKTGFLEHDVAITITASLSITASVSASAEAKAEVGVPLLAEAEASIGVTTGISNTAGGSYSTSTTDKARWTYSVPAGYIHGARVLADWFDGHWSASRYVHSWYFVNSGWSGSWENTDCDQVTGESLAAKQYSTWSIDFLPDQKCQ